MPVTNPDRRATESRWWCSWLSRTTWLVDSCSAAEIFDSHLCLSNGLSLAETSSFGMGTPSAEDLLNSSHFSSSFCPVLTPAGFSFEKLYLVLPLSLRLKSPTVSGILPFPSQTHSDSDWIPSSLSLQLVKYPAPISLPFPKALLSHSSLQLVPAQWQALTTGASAMALSSSPMPHSWCWGAQHPVAPIYVSLTWMPFGTSLLSTHRSHANSLVWAFSLFGCSYHNKEARVCFFPLWPSLAVNSCSSDFCAICNCVLSQPESSPVSSIALVNSRQAFHVTHSPWNTFYQNLLQIGISSLTFCDSSRPSVKSADGFLTTLF